MVLRIVKRETAARGLFAQKASADSADLAAGTRMKGRKSPNARGVFVRQVRTIRIPGAALLTSGCDAVSRRRRSA